MAGKVYDRAYFDKWYRDPRWRVGSRAELQRKVLMVVALAEFHLERPLENVLDVGCGEAPWRAELKRLRPEIDYLGLDASEYVVGRYGRQRDIRLARFGQLGELRFERRFDLIVCSDVLHYLPAAEIRRGLSGFGELLEGMAYLDVFTRSDQTVGDNRGYIARAPAWYRGTFAAAGLIPCGAQGWLSPRILRPVSAMERGPG
ncbi:MAG TPA: class I SAM-dependent methyltransferase [Rhodanobacteraceae bacterium]|nr:class I SAM-dependent methyltransferase [Rhodanobacteraceae bacterium]